MKKIIFVCKGNMHRSPIAERVFKNEMKRRHCNSVKVDSYGLHGFILPSPKGRCLKDYPTEYELSKPHLDKRGINMEDHKFKPLTKEVLEESKLVITMHPQVSKLLLERYPKFKNKVFLITDLCSKKIIIRDVDGSSDPNLYKETIENTIKCVKESFDKIIKLSKDKMKFQKQAKIILNTCLEVKQSDRILIVTDKNKKTIAEAIEEVAKKIVDVVDLIEIPIPKTHGTEPPEEVGKKMLNYNVIIAPTTRSITHTNASRNAARKGAKVATMPGINEKIMEQSMLADYNEVERMTNQVLEKVKDAETISIQTDSGTKLSFSVKGRKWFSDTGKITHSGNLPGGEVFIPPLEETANGKIVIDDFRDEGKIYAPKGTEIMIEDGKVIKTSNENCEIAKLFREIKDGTNIAEFGIGTNYKAKLIGKVLQDEKAIGTCHIAFGSNFSMGGKIKTDMHIDTVLRNPTIKIDGKVIIRKGKLV